MSAGISGSKTVFSAATMPFVSCSSSSEGIVVAWISGLFGLASGSSAAAASVAGVASVSLIAVSKSREERMGLRQPLHKGVNFGAGVVEAEGSAAGGGHAVASQKRLRAMGAGADGDPLAVDDGGHIVRVRALH